MRMGLLSLFIVAGVACVPVPVDFAPYPDIDSDEDGLLDREESSLGTDPAKADSDGDGHSDGIESNAGTDPLDGADHPYIGGYPIDTDCRDSVIPTGHTVGEIAEDFALLDQHGESVKLHDFCGHTVLLLTSAAWCGPCIAEAPLIGDVFNRYVDDGLMVITLLGENTQSQEPSVEQLMQWASEFDLSHPVVADGGWAVSNRFPFGGYIPTMHVIGPGGEVLATDVILDESQIVAYLP